MQGGVARTYMYSHAAKILALECALQRERERERERERHAAAALLQLYCSSVAAAACLQCVFGGSETLYVHTRERASARARTRTQR